MNQYEIIGMIGEGTYGVVLKARRIDTGRVVAIKKFKEGEDDEQVKKTALREVRLLKQLRHANIVSLLEVFRRPSDLKLFLVFEFVEKTILEELDEHPYGLKETDVRIYSFQLVQALDYCHSLNVAHRDVKPENILIDTQTKHLKLCDFGFARNLGGAGATYTDYVATRWYRCPELLVGDVEYTQSVDVWAVGCLVAEVATGVPLFPGESDLDQLLLILRCVGGLTPKQQHAFSHNPQYKGVSLPTLRHNETLDKKLAGAIRNASLLAFLKTTLIVDPHLRATCASLLSMPYFVDEGFVVNSRSAPQQQQQQQQQHTAKPTQPRPPPKERGEQRSSIHPPSPPKEAYSSGDRGDDAKRAPVSRGEGGGKGSDAQRFDQNWGNLFLQAEERKGAGEAVVAVQAQSGQNGQSVQGAVLPPEPPRGSSRDASGGGGNLPSLARVPSREGSATMGARRQLGASVPSTTATEERYTHSHAQAQAEKHRQVTPLVGFPSTAKAEPEEKEHPSRRSVYDMPGGVLALKAPPPPATPNDAAQPARTNPALGTTTTLQQTHTRDSDTSHHQALRQRDLFADARGSSRDTVREREREREVAPSMFASSSSSSISHAPEAKGQAHHYGHLHHAYGAHSGVGHNGNGVHDVGKLGAAVREAQERQERGAVHGQGGGGGGAKGVRAKPKAAPQSSQQPHHYPSSSLSFLLDSNAQMLDSKSLSYNAGFNALSRQTTLLPDLSGERLDTGFESPAVVLKAKAKKKRVGVKKAPFGQGSLFRGGPVAHSSYINASPLLTQPGAYGKPRSHYFGAGAHPSRSGIVMGSRPVDQDRAFGVSLGAPKQYASYMKHGK